MEPAAEGGSIGIRAGAAVAEFVPQLSPPPDDGSTDHNPRPTSDLHGAAMEPPVIGGMTGRSRPGCGLRSCRNGARRLSAGQRLAVTANHVLKPAAMEPAAPWQGTPWHTGDVAMGDRATVTEPADDPAGKIQVIDSLRNHVVLAAMEPIADGRNTAR
jgi:hypothetical protein